MMTSAFWSVCLAVALGVVPAASANAETDPLTSRMGSDGLCFSRTYDKDHLTRHPAQKIVTALASFRRDALRIMFAEREHKHFISAGCGWQAQAGRDIKDKPLLAAFKGTGGFDCIVTVSRASAEEGGYLILDPTPDGKSITLYLDSSVAARTAVGAKAGYINLGGEDRVFRLTRAPSSLCKAMNSALSP